MDGTEKAVVIGAVAIGGYFLYESFFSTAATSALPADAQFAGSLPAGSLFAVPQSMSSLTAAVAGPATTSIAYLYYGPAEGLYYLTYSAPTVSTPNAPSASSTDVSQLSATGSTVTTSPAVPTAPTAPPAAPATSPGAMAAIWAKATAAAANDASYIANNGQLTGSQWNFYLSDVQPTAPAGYTGAQWPPEVPNTSSPVTAAQYWGQLEPILSSSGLSGLGCGCDTGSGLLWLLVGSALTAGLLAMLGRGRTL
jgi:hypothetical protein